MPAKRKHPSKKPTSKQLAKPKHVKNRKHPKAFIRARQQQILKMYANGIPTDVIAAQLQMTNHQVQSNLNHAIERMIEFYAQATPQQTFVRYAAFQMGIVQKLAQTYEKFTSDPKSVQYSAGISALKTMSDIYDKVLTQGQTFGVIQKKKADRKSIEGKAKDIRNQLQQEVTQLNRLISQIDDSTYQRSRLSDIPTIVEEGIVYTRIIRKPLTDDRGIIRSIPDWKFKQALYEPGQSNPIPKSQLTPTQKEQLQRSNPSLEERANQVLDSAIQKELLEKELLQKPTIQDEEDDDE